MINKNLPRTEPTYFGHRKRLKEKYCASGLAGLHEYEVLELLLFYAIPRRDTKAVAKELLLRFHTIAGVLDADSDELQAVRGISRHTALFIRSVKDIAALYACAGMREKDLLSSPKAVVAYFRTLLKGSPNEELHVLLLNARNRLITSARLHTGTVNASAVYPRKIVELALKNHAVGAIVVHNHPGGSLSPSDDDQRATKAVKNALATIDTSLLDHIIIAGNGHFSFRESGLLP